MQVVPEVNDVYTPLPSDLVVKLCEVTEELSLCTGFCIFYIFTVFTLLAPVLYRFIFSGKRNVEGACGDNPFLV